MGFRFLVVPYSRLAIVMSGGCNSRSTHSQFAINSTADKDGEHVSVDTLCIRSPVIGLCLEDP